MKYLLWLLSYPRAYLASIFIAFYTVFWSVLVIISGFLPKTRQSGDLLIYIWSRVVLFVNGIKVSWEGLENIPEEGAIYVFNHCNLYDIPVILVAVRKSLRFGAKTELFKIPFFGSAMRSFGILEIHRSDRKKVLELYRQSLSRVSEGYNYILAPEGTRKDGKEIYRFKSGPFVMAISGELPIVPLVLTDVWRIMPKGDLFANKGCWSRKVGVKVLPPIPTKGYTLDDLNKVQDQTFAAMTAAYPRPQG